ncbi:MAG: glycosyltransferase [bacterium]|nr:glycosyltransferase [bacterium]
MSYSDYSFETKDYKESESKERFDASIVIPTFNRKLLLDRCLTYLFSQDYPKDRYEIVVVDDGSSDGTREMVSSKHPPCLLKYLYQEQSGPNRARNLGIREAEGGVIVFIDSDIFAPPSLLSSHLRIHKVYKNIIVSGPLTRTQNLNEDFKDIRKRRLRKFFDLSGVSLITSNLSVRREHLLKIGGFSEEFRGYGWHDWDLGQRLKGQGLIPRRDINAIAYHYTEEMTDMQEICKKRRERGENAILYLKRHPHFRILLSINLHFLLYDKLIKHFIEDERFKKRFPRLAKRWLLIHHYANGLKEGLRRHFKAVSRKD